MPSRRGDSRGSIPAVPTATANGSAPVDKAEAMGMELGQTGLKANGGVIREEWLRALQGDRGRKVLAEMRDSALIGTGLYALAMLVRRAEWRTVPADGRPEDDPDVEFADSLRHDMSHSWSALIGEIMAGMPVFGWQLHEVVYKRRAGERLDSPGESSRYSDGLIGWRKLAVRSQDTLVRWDLDPKDGGIRGMWQRRTDGSVVCIPIEKAALFRTTVARGNPEGRSALRTAYRPWYLAKRVEEYEAIGVERDLTGIPRFWLPEELLDPGASGTHAAARQAFEDIGKNLRNDEQATVLMPLVYDGDGNKRYDMDLISAPGSKQIDTQPILARYGQQQLMTMLADVVLLGHEKVGTQALSSSKVDLLAASLDSWLEGMGDVWNRHLLPRVFTLNGKPTGELPSYEASSVAPDDVAAVVDALAKLATSGAPLWPSEELMEWVADKVGFPAPEPDEQMVPMAPPRPPQPGAGLRPPAEDQPEVAQPFRVQPPQAPPGPQ